MRYMARHRSIQDKLMFVFSAKTLTQMYRRLRFVREYAAYQRAQGELLKQKQNQVDEKHDQLARVRGHKSNLLVKGRQVHSQMESKKVEQQKVVESLQNDQKVLQSVISDRQKKQQAINAQIDRLIAIEIRKARERAMEEARAQAAARAAAAKQRAEELARKREAARRAAEENARRIAEAKAREARAKAEAEGKNSFSTDRLVREEIHNYSNYKGKSIALGLSGVLGGDTLGQGEAQRRKFMNVGDSGVGKTFGIGHAEKHKEGLTTGSINTANLTIHDDAGQRQLTGESAAEAAKNANRGITLENNKARSGAASVGFDADKVTRDITSTAQVMQGFDGTTQEIKHDLRKQAET